MISPDEWDEVERRIVRAWSSGAVTDALRQIESVLELGDDEQRARALVYRGSIQEEAANWRAAKDDFVQAAGLFRPGAYARYTAELSVGGTLKRAGEIQEALKWYRAALLTCAQADEPFSGATATKALLALAPELSPSDRELARTVTAKSWHVLNLPNQPNLDDLAGTTEILMQRASDPNA
jgi:tetratricopeptide (TPR) repeat protein